jgi:uncharacterized protein with NRDE domain
MCLLALRWRIVPGAPVVLAANRDESLGRAFEPPRLHEGPVPFVAPVDRTAGGTWLGLNAAGIAVALTNRPQREAVPTRRSRGLLVADALRAASADRLRDALESHLRGQRSIYNNFHLLVASADAAFVVRYHDGWTELTDLAEGDHFLTNEDELDEPRPAGVAAAPAATAAAEADRLAAALADHSASLPGGRAPCKHGEEGRGTVSATVLALPDAGLPAAILRFAAGPPCTAPFEDLSALARGLSR